MAKVNFQDPGSSEVISPHVTGLQESVMNIQEALGMQTTSETDIALSEVYISETDRYRIFQAPAGKRNWVSSPAPVIKKNGSPIATGFTIEYGGGAIILDPPAQEGDVFTADATVVNSTSGTIVNHLAESATEEQAGHIELATESEVLAGIDTEKAVTPATAKATKAPLRYTSTTITTNTTLSLTDANTRIICNSAEAITVTVPTNASVAFSVGDEIELISYGVGTVTIAGDVGVTIRSKESKLSIDGQYAVASLLKIATDEWLLIGALA